MLTSSEGGSGTFSHLGVFGVQDGKVNDEPYLNPSGRRDLIATDIDDAVKVMFRTVLVAAAILAVPTLLTLLF